MFEQTCQRGKMKNAEKTETQSAGTVLSSTKRASMCARSLAICAMCVFFFPCFSNASENERYKAIPIGGGGGNVFILDTREGHIWRWSGAGQAQANSAGINPSISYQGNVRANMKPSPQAQPKILPPFENNKTQSGRF